MKFGFIGLGKMGGSICKTLLRNGADVTVFDINLETVKAFAALGGKPAGSARAAASGMDAVVTSLPMPADLENLLLGPDGIYEVMPKGSVLIDISTVGPDSARAFADAAKKRGLKFLACPLGKGPAQAEAGEAPIFAGGRREVFDEYKAALEKMGGPVIFMGDVEQSTAFKLITNLAGMTNVAVMAEAVKLARQMGIDPEVFLDSYKDTGAMSYQSNVRAPWIFNNDFAPRFAVNLALKDVRLGNRMAAQAGVTCPTFQLAQSAYEKAAAEQLGNEDCVAVYKLL